MCSWASWLCANTSDLCSRDTRFQSWTGYWLRTFVVFLQSLHETADISHEIKPLPLPSMLFLKDYNTIICCSSQSNQQHHYLLTPWNRVLLEKLTGFQLVKKFPAFYETQRFIAAFTSARHLSLFWASSIQSIPPHPTSWRSIYALVHQVVSFPQVSPINQL